MGKQLRKATSVFTIKKAAIKGNEKTFTDKILNNHIGKEYILIIAPQNYQHGPGWFSGHGVGAVKEIRNLIKNDAGGNGKFMFVHQALRRMRLNKENEYNWSVLIYTKGYTKLQITKTKDAFRVIDPNCNFVEISSYKDAVNYINSKDTQQKSDSKNLRKLNPIERIFFYCHGFVGKLAMGLDNRHSGDSLLDWDENVASQLKTEAFSKTAKIYSFSCKTGLGNLEIEKEDSIYKVYVDSIYSGHSSPTTMAPSMEPHYKTKKLPLLGERSLAQKFANATGATVYAYCSRSDYEDTLNTPDELDFMAYYEAGEGKKLARKNPTYKYLLKKENRKQKDKTRYEELSIVRKRRMPPVDGAIFDPLGARYPVKGGTTPKGTPNDMKTYIKP